MKTAQSSSGMDPADHAADVSPPAHPLTVFVGTLHFSATLKGRVSPGGLVRDYKKQSLLIRAIGGLGVSREV